MKKEYLSPEIKLVKFKFSDEILLRPSSEDDMYNVIDDDIEETGSGDGRVFK